MVCGALAWFFWFAVLGYFFTVVWWFYTAIGREQIIDCRNRNQLGGEKKLSR